MVSNMSSSVEVNNSICPVTNTTNPVVTINVEASTSTLQFSSMSAKSRKPYFDSALKSKAKNDPKGPQKHWRRW